MKRKALSRVLCHFAVAALATLLFPPLGSATAMLDSAQNFAVLGHETVTNAHSAPNPPTQVYGDLGVTPNIAVTGFYPDGTVSGGSIHTNDAVAQFALADATIAYTALAGLPFDHDYTGIVLGSPGYTVLTPGVYYFGSSAQLTGAVTLDFQGNPNADFVFQIASTLTTASGSSVNAINGNATNGVYWQVGSSATLGTDTAFAGNIIALASVTLDPTAKILCGRAFALTGAVTLTDNFISNNNTAEDFGSGRPDFGSFGFSGGSGPAASTATPTATSTMISTFTPTATSTMISTFTPTATSTMISTFTPTTTSTMISTFTSAPTGTSTRTPTMTPTSTSTSSPSPTMPPTPQWTPNGSAVVTSDQPLSGLVLYGDKCKHELGGLSASASLANKHIMAHFASSSMWFSGLVVANPSDTNLAHVNVTAFSSSGVSLGQADRTIGPRAKLSEVLSTLIGPDLGTGWLEVTSDMDVTTSLVYGDLVAGGSAALPSCQVGSRLVLPHFVQNSAWWTGIAVLNVSDAPVDVTLTAYDSSGILIQQAIQSLPAKNKIMGYVENILPDTAGKTGWVLVECPSICLAGVLVYGDNVAVSNKICALPAMLESTEVYLSDFKSDVSWWTGVALVNANDAPANVAMNAFAPDGTLIDAQSITVAAKSKVSGYVNALFNLGGQSQGWVKVSSDLPISGFEVFNADDLASQTWGLAAIEGQPSGQKLYYAHYTVSHRWWTLFAMANLSGTNAASVRMETFGEGGDLSGMADLTIPPNGRVSETLLDLLGL